MRGQKRNCSSRIPSCYSARRVSVLIIAPLVGVILWLASRVYLVRELLTLFAFLTVFFRLRNMPAFHFPSVSGSCPLGRSQDPITLAGNSLCSTTRYPRGCGCTHPKLQNFSSLNGSLKGVKPCHPSN